MRNSKKNKQVNKKPQGWKFYDDYAGFECNSEDAVIDDNGFITIKKFVDERDPRKDPIQVQETKTPPWTRPRKEPNDVSGE